MDTMEAIAKRKSCRAYKDMQISEEQLETILQAANAAPISMGRFEDIQLVVVQDKDLITKMEILVAKFALDNYGMSMNNATGGAPTLILVAGRKAEGLAQTQAYCNTGCIIQNMMIAATDLNLGSLYMYAIAAAAASDEHLCEELTIPADFFPVSMMAVGIPAEPLTEHEPTDKSPLAHIN